MNEQKTSLRQSVHQKLIELAQEKVTPEQAAKWMKKRARNIEQDDDCVIWNIMWLLFRAEDIAKEKAPHSARDEFRKWLKLFEDACLLNPLDANNYTFEPTKLIIDQWATPLVLPTRQETREKLYALSIKSILRREATAWAMPWIWQLEQGIIHSQDCVISDTLMKIYCADIPATHEPRLFKKTDFKQWFKKYDEECAKHPIENL